VVAAGGGQQLWIWSAIVVFLLAPPVVMVVDGVLDLRRRMVEAAWMGCQVDRAAPGAVSTRHIRVVRGVRLA
jgi:hypothetical protein